MSINGNLFVSPALILVLSAAAADLPPSTSSALVSNLSEQKYKGNG